MRDSWDYRTVLIAAVFAAAPIASMATPVESPAMQSDGAENTLAVEQPRQTRPELQLGNEGGVVRLSADSTLHLADQLAKAGQLEQARDLYEQLLSRFSQAPQPLAYKTPLDAPAPQLTPTQEQATLGGLLLVQTKLADYAAALETSHRLLLTAPQSSALRSNHAVLLLRSGNPESAADMFREVVKDAPNFYSAQNNLARLLSQKNSAVFSPEEAFSLATQLNQRTQYQNPVYLDTLAAAQHASGHSTAAAKTARTAVDIALAQGMLLLAKAISDQVPAYEASGKR